MEENMEEASLSPFAFVCSLLHRLFAFFCRTQSQQRILMLEAELEECHSKMTLQSQHSFKVKISIFQWL